MVSTHRRTRRLVAVLAGSALTVTGVGLLGVGASPASASDAGMYSQVNASRAAHGLRAYAWNSHLAEVAGEQAARMARKHLLYHNPNLTSDVGDYRFVGENVGYGPDSSTIEQAFMNSAPHRANILDRDYTQIGIASVRDGGGRLWVAQVFREPSGSSSGSTTTVKKKSTTQRTTTHRTTTHRATHRATSPRTSSGSASAPRPTVAPKPKPKPAASRPAPQPTLAQRIDYATSNADATASDPLADALAFAATMNAIAG